MEAALRDGTPLLMVHDLRKGQGAAPFGSIIDRTPSCLRKIYRGQLALPLYDGDEHRRVCLRVMLRALQPQQSSNVGVRALQPQRPWKFGLRTREVDVPPLLELAQSAKV